MLAGTATAVTFCAAHQTSASCEAAVRSSLISAVEQEDICYSLSEPLRPFLPFVPTSVRDLIVAKVVAALVQTVEEAPLDDATRKAIARAAQFKSAGADDEAIAKLAHEVCQRIDVPLLSKAQEQKLVSQTIVLMLGDTSLLSLATDRVARAHRSFTRMLLDPKARKELATRVNDAVDVPGLTEAQEQIIFEKAIDGEK